MSILFELDALTNTEQRFHWDPVTEKFTITDRQEVQDLMDINKSIRNDGYRKNRNTMMRRVGSVPLNIYMDLKAKGIIDDRKKLAAWLNDPDNRAWRTDDSKI
jgi:hypothetical protein